MRDFIVRNVSPSAGDDNFLVDLSKRTQTWSGKSFSRVIPFFDEEGFKLQRVLTDRGTEYCGNPEHHEYELYLAVEDIDHAFEPLEIGLQLCD